jgi:YVTN family beta-propeller protein
MLLAPVLALAALPAGAVLHTPSASAATSGRPLTAYVANMGDNTVTPINLATNTAGTPIPVGNGPAAIAITPDGATAWVLGENDGTLTPINTATNTPGTKIQLTANDPVALAITPDGRKAYVAGHGSSFFGAATVTPVDLVTRTAKAPVPFNFAGPTAIAISPDGSKAYVASDEDGGVEVIDTVTDTVVDGFNDGGGHALSETITPDGASLYLPQFTFNSVNEVGTLAPNAVSQDVGGPGGLGDLYQLSRDVALSPDGAVEYITDLHGLHRRDASTFQSVAISSGGLFAPAITPDGSEGYLTDSAANTVTPFDASTLTLGTPIPVGTDPWAIAITPDQAPVARLSVKAQPIGTPTTFDASASTVTFGTIASYAWDFGDGTTATTTTPTTTHTYTSGSYTASVTETSSGGTSTAVVFTGQTAMRNGGARARATALGSLARLGAPVVTQVTPQIAAALGGDTVSVIGSGFTGASSVLFGTTPAASFTVNGDNSITAIAPASDDGPVDVTVTNSLGTSAASSADLYLYVGSVSNSASCTGTACGVTVAQYGTAVTGSTGTSTCNVCNFVGGIDPIQLPPTSLCPSGQQGTEEAGWVAIQQQSSPLSALNASLTHMQAINGFIADNNYAALQMISVCYIDGIPRPLPSGGAARHTAAVSTPASYPLKTCAVTKNKVPCIQSMSLLPDGSVQANLRLPATGSTFFMYSTPAHVTRFSPANALPGQTVSISGIHLSTVSAVTIGGVDATIGVRNDNHLYIKVPQGAQSGPITLNTPQGSVVTPTALNLDPKITTFDKTSGKRGAIVKITGFNLTSVTKVAFNGKPAQFAVLSNAALIAVVPRGATTGPITLSTPRTSVVSSKNFIVV